MKKLSILAVTVLALALSACSLTPKAPETTVDTGAMMTGAAEEVMTGEMVMTGETMMTGTMMTGN